MKLINLLSILAVDFSGVGSMQVLRVSDRFFNGTVIPGYYLGLQIPDIRWTSCIVCVINIDRSQLAILQANTVN